MGLFYTAPHKPASSGASSFSGSSHISSRELKEQVRYDLHDRLGKTKGEAIYNTLHGHLDKDGGFGSKSISGREIDETLHALKENHQDNLHADDLNHVREILDKHFND